MKKFKLILLIIVLLGVFALPAPVSAQDYAFKVTAMEVEAYVEEDGTLSIWYLFEFQNLPTGAAIEYVDIGMPSSSYSLKSIQAEVDGQTITKIEDSPYVTNGFALNLDNLAIPSGQTGTVTAWISGVKDVITPYDNGDRENYANFQFSPTWFDSAYDKSSGTEYRVTIILPPGVGDDEGVYYSPANWPGVGTPDDVGRTAAEDRVYYSWYTNNADLHSQYTFGAAFPNQYIPADSVVTKIPSGGSTSSGGSSGIISTIFSGFGSNICCFGFGLLFVTIFGWSIYQGTVGAQKRKMKYLPPKMKIEGHGIKRGLTAVEAAILMEQPLDKIMTMVLFGAIKKEAATVEQSEPLKLTVTDPLPEGLHQYEVDFLQAFKETDAKRRTALQKMTVDLVNSVSKKMKGFSRKETIAYYEDIMRRAWKMVEEAQTPEVKSEYYDQTLEWTMLDDDYAERTRRTFVGSPVYVPMWWPRYSPTYRRNIGRMSDSTPSIGGTSSGGSSGGSVSLPHIPGSDFAAGVVNGVTGMAAGVVGNLTSFTSGITTRTNPIPVSSKSGSGGFRGGGGSGGCACACACACAGCACACAGGGR
ncbi:MAG: hypothetical protein H0S82_03670 [Anaerolineaceae bacterium]|nr:hypothetical protein [Anaerolineaceae bacterium]